MGCLVVAMSGTAMLLGWMDTSIPLRSTNSSPLETLRLARLAVALDVEIREDLWYEVQVIASRSTGLPSRMLAASAGGPKWHFAVDADGIPSRGRDWAAQRTYSQDPGTVHILVTTPDPDNPMSEAQWLGVRALITSLTEAVRCAEESLPVRLHHTWAHVYGVEPTSYFHVPPIDSGIAAVSHNM